MFQTLKLMATPQVYKENKTETGGQFVDGKWVEGTITLSYEAIDGFVEPYTRSESSDALMSGVKSSESLYLYTNRSLILHNDLPNNQATATVIYTEDPTVNPAATAYLAWDKEPWKTNMNFKLVNQDYDKVILVRKEKI
ncbi:MAG: hypothetical protein GY861_08020 [bacterium]|nr:hypothetical protein [bacterium]